MSRLQQQRRVKGNLIKAIMGGPDEDTVQRIDDALKDALESSKGSSLNWLLYGYGQGETSTLGTACIHGYSPLLAIMELTTQMGRSAPIEEYCNKPINEKGYGPLQAASKYGHQEIVELLLKRGASPNYAGDDMHFTPLIMAVRSGHIGVIKVLLKAGAKVDDKSKSDVTALHSTTVLSDEDKGIEVAKMLLANGADASIRGMFETNFDSNTRTFLLPPHCLALLHHRHERLCQVMCDELCEQHPVLEKVVFPCNGEMRMTVGPQGFAVVQGLHRNTELNGQCVLLLQEHMCHVWTKSLDMEERVAVRFSNGNVKKIRVQNLAPTFGVLSQKRVSKMLGVPVHSVVQSQESLLASIMSTMCVETANRSSISLSPLVAQHVLAALFCPEITDSDEHVWHVYKKGQDGKYEIRHIAFRERALAPEEDEACVRAGLRSKDHASDLTMVLVDPQTAVWCAACGIVLPKKSFSKTQLGKDDGRCTKCVNKQLEQQRRQCFEEQQTTACKQTTMPSGGSADGSTHGSTHDSTHDSTHHHGSNQRRNTKSKPFCRSSNVNNNKSANKPANKSANKPANKPASSKSTSCKASSKPTKPRKPKRTRVREAEAAACRPRSNSTGPPIRPDPRLRAAVQHIRSLPTKRVRKCDLELLKGQFKGIALGAMVTVYVDLHGLSRKEALLLIRERCIEAFAYPEHKVDRVRMFVCCGAGKGLLDGCIRECYGRHGAFVTSSSSESRTFVQYLVSGLSTVSTNDGAEIPHTLVLDIEKYT